MHSVLVYNLSTHRGGLCSKEGVAYTVKDFFDLIVKSFVSFYRTTTMREKSRQFDADTNKVPISQITIRIKRKRST